MTTVTNTVSNTTNTLNIQAMGIRLTNAFHKSGMTATQFVEHVTSTRPHTMDCTVGNDIGVLVRLDTEEGREIVHFHYYAQYNRWVALNYSDNNNY